MAVRPITATDALARLEAFDAIIDVRSPAEYTLDHLPLAQNWPVLDDEQRRDVGTQYKQESPFEARKRGAAMVARQIASLLESRVLDKPREWKPLVYCWRGGQRSGTLGWFLDQVGFRVCVLQGGYKAFRQAMCLDLDGIAARLEFVVIGGRTGTGKSRLLKALAQQGAQVLDLEALACHRGSVLGGLPGTPQPSQKNFDNRIWQALRRLDPSRVVYVESESRRIGALQLPEALILKMRGASRVVLLDMPMAARIDLLLQDYGHFSAQPEAFCLLLQALVEPLGPQRVSQWQAMARAGRWAELFEALVCQHYDPLYQRSMGRNFRAMANPQAIHMTDAGTLSLHQTALMLMAQEEQPRA